MLDPARSVVAIVTIAGLTAGPVLAQTAASGLPAATVRHGQVAEIIAGHCDGSGNNAAVEVVPALIGALAGTAADFLVGWVGRALQDRKDALNGQFLATGVGERQSRNSCLRIYRGPIDTNGAPARSTAPSRADFYLEADIAVAADSWTLTPYRLDYRASAARRASKTKFVNVVVAFTAATLAKGAKPDAGAPLAVFRLDFGELAVGNSYTAGLVNSIKSRATLPPEAKSFNVAALVTESKDASLALEALIGAFNGNKDKLSSALTEVISSAAGAKK